MNEINNTINSVFVLFEATINQMIDKRVEAKRDDGLDRLWEENTALKVRIKALEEKMGALTGASIVSLNGMTERIDALENCQDNDQLENNRRLVALETGLPAIPQPTVKFDFESDEFRAAVVKVIDKHTMGDEFLNPLIEALAASDKFNDEINEAAHKAASDAAEEVMDTHNNDYNHDDIHEMSDMDEDAVREIVQESMRDTVNDLLDGATVSIRV
jgi:hypothetical protein